MTTWCSDAVRLKSDFISLSKKHSYCCSVAQKWCIKRKMILYQNSHLMKGIIVLEWKKPGHRHTFRNEPTTEFKGTVGWIKKPTDRLAKGQEFQSQSSALHSHSTVTSTPATKRCPRTKSLFKPKKYSSHCKRRGKQSPDSPDDLSRLDDPICAGLLIPTVAGGLPQDRSW